MSTPTKEQLKKLERLAKVLDNGDVALLSMLDELSDKTASELQAIQAVVTEAVSIAETTKKMKGEQGIKGDKGDTGERGKNGLDGTTGATGATGERGLTGEKGDKGDMGEKGKDGMDGEKGADGFVDDATVGYLEDELKRIEKKNGGYGQVIRKLRAGTSVTIDDTNMEYPIINSSGADQVTRETPSGLQDSVNTTYTLSFTPIVGTEEVFLNGMLQEPGVGNDYTITTSTITYSVALTPTDKMRVTYRK
jgi:hypothetical protein